MLAIMLAGCSSDRLAGRSEPSFGDRITNLFGSKPAQPQPQAQGSVTPAISADDLDCPTVTIRTGASTFLVTAPGLEPSVTNVRYQATFGQTARECKVIGNSVLMRVGIEGRVILGPAGGPGQIEFPVRYAVVQEGPEPKTVITKLHWVKVDIPAGETNVPFTEVEEQLSFPVPRPTSEIENYIVYVGFDRAASKEPEKKSPVKKPPRPAKRPT